MATNDHGCKAVFIHNIEHLSTDDVRKYCSQYDRSVRCHRRKDKLQHEFIRAVFSSGSHAARAFLDDRPHFIDKYRINAYSADFCFNDLHIVCADIEDDWLSITEDILFDYVSSTYGHVLNCTLYPSRRHAFIEFAHWNNAQYACSIPRHIIHGQSVILRRRQPDAISIPYPFLSRLVHIGNFFFHNENQFESLLAYCSTYGATPELSMHKDTFDELYALVRFHPVDRFLLARPHCINGRVLRVTAHTEDQLAERNNFLLVRNVPHRLNNYNLLEYFSQFDHILNCYPYENSSSSTFRIQFEHAINLDRLWTKNRTHSIKGALLEIERDNEE